MILSRLHIGLLVSAFPVFVLLSATAHLHAQMLPAGATPRGVVYAFLSRTASEDDTLDRSSFAERLTGRLADVDPSRFNGLAPAGSRLRIDTIPDLGLTDEGLREVVAFATIESSKGKQDLYIFCAGDSIWRIESIARFPTASQRAQIISSLNEIDSLAPTYRRLHADLRRLLLPDDSLRSLGRRNLSALEVLSGRLATTQSWQSFAIQDIDFSELDEYRELDDDIPAEELVFYTLDRRSLEHVKRELGIRRIERDRRYAGIQIMVAGEIESGSYGYISATSADQLPPLSPDGYLTLKPVAAGWWLFRRVTE